MGQVGGLPTAGKRAARNRQRRDRSSRGGGGVGAEAPRVAPACRLQPGGNKGQGGGGRASGGSQSAESGSQGGCFAFGGQEGGGGGQEAARRAAKVAARRAAAHVRLATALARAAITQGLAEDAAVRSGAGSLAAGRGQRRARPKRPTPPSADHRLSQGGFPAHRGVARRGEHDAATQMWSRSPAPTRPSGSKRGRWYLRRRQRLRRRSPRRRRRRSRWRKG